MMRKRLYRFGKDLYWSISPKYRQRILFFAYSHFGFLFKNLPNYRAWAGSRGLLRLAPWLSHNLVDIDQVQPVEAVAGTIAIHLHIYYDELAAEFITYFRRMPFPYDLYVSVANDRDLERYKRLFSGLPLCAHVEVERVPNRGRDMAPLFSTFGKELARHDYIAHVHTKKSAYNQGATAGWREYLCETLFASEDRLRRIFSLMQPQTCGGIVYPQNYVYLPYWANTWLSNRRQAKEWSSRLGLGPLPRGYFDYPASSMFWARSDALIPLFEAGISPDDFPQEQGQTDGTLAHCLERLLVLCAVKSGFNSAILLDQNYPSWSSWRLDHYLSRTREQLHTALMDPQVKLIAFDIFDTLLLRPLLDPEMVKILVSRRVGDEAGRLYMEYRPAAEGNARELKNSDVGLDEIYASLGRLTRLPDNTLEELRRMEELVEAASLEARPEAVDLYKKALATGKPVVLISDMFLPRQLIEKCLHSLGITGWAGVFVSSEIHKRKDDGGLYQHVLAHYQLKPSELLMVGDDEHSDVQIPADMGASVLHTLKPVELARGLPRLSKIIARHEYKADADADLTLGLILRKNLAPLVYPGFDHGSLGRTSPYEWGFGLVGPLLVSFADWLLRTARADGIDTLYFLSREGRILKQVYDVWTRGLGAAPNSEYLVASRRAAGMAAISNFEDILNVARTTYYSNTLDKFLQTRYGVTPTPVQWDKYLHSFALGSASMVTVQNRQIKDLKPLLQALEPQILTQAGQERASFLQYLQEKGLPETTVPAVVDIGYSGSVQSSLNKLLGPRVHGYYMMTHARARQVSQEYNVILRGCFVQDFEEPAQPPTLLEGSFVLEKLLSSDEAQVEYYTSDPSGRVVGHFRPLDPAEQSGVGLRQQVHAGILNYADAAYRVRAELLPDFQPSCWSAQMLMDAFLDQLSQPEKALLSRIVLDDHYCGRDLVS